MSSAGPADAPNSVSDGPLAPYLALRSALSRQRIGDGGRAVCQALTQAMDGCLATLFGPLVSEKVALVAVGGYGRGELCLRSDIDLMLVCAGRVPHGAAERLFYPLWDAGLKVGHAVRTVPEALTAAAERLETLTALLDARLIAGTPSLIAELTSALSTGLRRGTLAVHTQLAAAEQARQAREPFQLLEVDVKDGRGGLRALHSLHWERRRRALMALEVPPPAAEEQHAHTSLLATRNALHATLARPHDRYTFEFRPAAAAWLGVDPDSAGRNLYLAMRTSDTLVTAYWESSWSDADSDCQVQTPTTPNRMGHRTAVSPLVMAANALTRPANAPIFTTEEATQIRTAPSASWDAGDRTALLRLLAAGPQGWDVFQALVALGWVSRIVPEWSHVVAAPQHVPFHLHPVDVHLWRTVTELLLITRAGSDEPWCREVAADLGSLDDVLIAALLHDIGKGWPGDHSATGAAAVTALLRRLGFAAGLTHTVTTAVRHHLLLPNVATRRDLANPGVIRVVADQVGNPRTLRVLYLLSVADARATGPTVWNTWKASLIRSLFVRTAEELDQRSTAMRSDGPNEAERVAALVEAAAGAFAQAAIVAHVRGMPAGYLAAFTLPELLEHLTLIVPHPGPDQVVVQMQPVPPAARVVVVTEDRPGLLSTLAGVFALHNLSVLDGRFYTREDGIVLDTFHVQDMLSGTIEPRRWDRFRQDMGRAVRGELALDERLREKAHAYRRPATAKEAVEVVVEQESAASDTVVEIHCGDRIGVLHDLAQTLFSLGLDIRLAKVDTQHQTVVDTFYVRSVDGAPLRSRADRSTLAGLVRDQLVARLYPDSQ